MNLLPEPAAPIADVGDIVTYIDRHGRSQTGKVLSVRAQWAWRAGKPPLIVYDLEHPTARNRRQGCQAKSILSVKEPS